MTDPLVHEVRYQGAPPVLRDPEPDESVAQGAALPLRRNSSHVEVEQGRVQVAQHPAPLDEVQLGAKHR
eukprot:5017221-Lingulodinium_polyedra.AAC.1